MPITIVGGEMFSPDVPQYPGLTTIPLPECPAVTETRTGSQTLAIDQPATDETWDLTAATWDCKTTFGTPPFYFPVRSSSIVRSCILGGTIIGPVDPDATRDEWYRNIPPGSRRSGDAATLVLPAAVPDNWVLLRDMYINDFEDAYDGQVSVAGRYQDAVIFMDHCRGDFIRDDAAEFEGSASLPDGTLSLAVNNCYLQGYTLFGFRPPGAVTAQNGVGSNWLTIENSLIWAVPMPVTSTDCGPTALSRGRCVTTGDPDIFLALYGFWKWSNEAPARVAVRNTIFRLDLPSYSSCQSQRWPAGVYDNVTVVWTGPGDYETAGECVNVLPDGVTLTTDVSVWDDAEAAWLAQ